MNGLARWAFDQLQKHFPDRFKQDFGASVQDVQTRCANGGADVFRNAVRQKAEQYRQQSPQAWANAQHAAQQGNFPGSNEPRKEQETQLQTRKDSNEI